MKKLMSFIRQFFLCPFSEQSEFMRELSHAAHLVKLEQLQKRMVLPPYEN